MAKGESFLNSQRGRAFRALRHREYRLLFTSMLISQAGFWVSHVSLQGTMAALSDNDPFMLGQLFFVMFLPAFVLAPLAGVAADRLPRRALVLVCYAGVAGISGVLAWLSATEALTPRLLLALAGALGTSFAFQGPAGAAITANSVPAKDVPSAVALHSALNNITRVGGPVLAAPMLASGRFELSFGIYAGCILAAGALIAVMRISPHDRQAEERGVWRRMVRGFEHARERRPALRALSVVAVLSVFGVGHTAVLPVFAEQVLGRLDAFAWLVSANGFGAIGGALIAGYRAPQFRRAALDLMLYGAGLLLFSFATSAWLAIGAQVLLGYFYFSATTALQTLVQTVIDDRMRGRVMSLFNLCWGGLVPFGGLAMGSLAQSFGVATSIACGATVCVLFGLGSYFVRADAETTRSFPS